LHIPRCNDGGRTFSVACGYRVPSSWRLLL
jgi:hypothetical protein